MLAKMEEPRVRLVHCRVDWANISSSSDVFNQVQHCLLGVCEGCICAGRRRGALCQHWLLWQKERGHLLSFGVLTMRTHCSAASAVSAQLSSRGSSLKSLCHALQSLSLAATAPGSSTLRL